MASASNNITIRAISECYIKPNQIVEESKKPFYLGSFELMQLSQCHLQIGLLFPELPSKDNDGSMDSFFEKLKDSLSSTLAHFFPLAGQFVTEIDEEKHESFVFVDCNKGPGAKFIRAVLDNVTVNDIVSPTYVPTTLVQSLFQLGQIPTNYDGHNEPLLVAQITELVNGIFFGVSINHSIVDGSSFWHFVSCWSEMFRSNPTTLSRPPNYDRWFPEGYGPIINFPYTHPDEFINRYKINENDPPIREVIFHFSQESIESLKEKANEECGGEIKISSFQALSALLWRSIIRSWGAGMDENNMCIFIVNARQRVKPPLSPNYFGSFIDASFNTIKVSELLDKSLGSVAAIFHKAVVDFDDRHVHDQFIRWAKSPVFYPPLGAGLKLLLISGSQREDAFSVDFGLGKAVALRTASNKYDGKVVFRPARDGKGSANIEVCLSQDAMVALQQDQEFVSFLK
ncbi:hypothetical protein V2J09_000145 [Rumex salicifolius]